MSVKSFIRETLPENTVLFTDASYDDSIIGLTFDGAAIYSYEKMIEEFMKDNECSEDEAIEWIEYNTIRALPYFPNPRPIIVSEVVA